MQWQHSHKLVKTTNDSWRDEHSSAGVDTRQQSGSHTLKKGIVFILIRILFQLHFLIILIVLILARWLTLLLNSDIKLLQTEVNGPYRLFHLVLASSTGKYLVLKKNLLCSNTRHCLIWLFVVSGVQIWKNYKTSTRKCEIII